MTDSGIGRQVQIREQHHVLAQKAELFRLWFFHFHHQMRAPGLLPGDQGSTSSGEAGVINACPLAGSPFDSDFKANAHQLTHGIGGERHPLFIGLDLPRNADAADRGGGLGSGHGGLVLIAAWRFLAFSASAGCDWHPPTAAEGAGTQFEHRCCLAPFEF